MTAYRICYHIAKQPFSEITYLPEAYIVSEQNGEAEYIEKQATIDTISSFGILIESTAHQQLLDICALLKPAALEQRFKPQKGRKNQTLAQLLTDPKTKEVLLNFVTRKLNTFYFLIQENNYLLGYHLKRKEAVTNKLIHIADRSIQPILNFAKTEDGIHYSFVLQDDKHTYLPKDQEIYILLNSPSWIILNKKLYQIQDLNANKLKPFLAKEKIVIEPKHVNTYIDKVIVPVIKNIEVQTEGFEIITSQKITSYTLEIVQDFAQQGYIAMVTFKYDNDTFDFHQRKNTRTQVQNKDGQISIHQTKRNPKAEADVIRSLTDLGLVVNGNLFLELAEPTSDSFAILQWVKNNTATLTKLGFTIKLPLILDKPISLADYQISVIHEKQKDWFDIKGMVNVGSYQIPFSKFVPYIKKNDRYFPLENDEIFIIPLEWMTRYKKLADFGTIEKDKITLTKSKFTVLKDIIPPEEFEFDINVTDTESYEESDQLKAKLRPYQLEGVQWLVGHYQNGLGACLADDMGLGKTLQTIATLVYAKEQLTPDQENIERIQFDLFSTPLEVRTYLKALVVLPSSLVFNWAQEIIKFAPHLNIVNYTGADRSKTAPYLESYDVILTTYNTIARDQKIVEKINFNYLIIDESQQIKNKESKIFQVINQIQAHHKISLSGTPIENSLSDLWSQMQFINPGILGSFPFFKDHFKIPIEKHQDQEKIAELKSLIDPFILRRTKEQVAKDLPDVSEQVRYIEMLPEQEKLYESEKSAARNMLLGIAAPQNNKIHIINTLTKLRQLANHPVLINKDSVENSGKFKEVTEYLQTLVLSNKKTLVFSSFVSHLKLYEQWCTEQGISYLTLTGNTASRDRASIVNQFQKDDSVSIFFISLKAGGVGLNLTKASYVLLLDPWWNPFIEKQAIARAHRIGQENKVIVTRFIAKNTIEEKILQLQEQKKTLSDEIIDINAIPEYIEQDLEVLLN